MHIIITIFVLIVLSGNAIAIDNIKSTTTQTEITKPRIIKSQADFFGLTQIEVDKIKTLRSQYRGFFDENISDVEVLGIFAKTEAEKRKYARLFAQTYRETTAKILAFQKFVNQAHIDLYGRQSMFDYIQVSKTPKRLSYSIDINDCNNDCIKYAKQFINEATTPVDLYFIGASSDDDIRIFAQKLNITKSVVSSRYITLNHANQ